MFSKFTPNACGMVSYCQAAGRVAKRKINQLEQFKKEEPAGAQRN